MTHLQTAGGLPEVPCPGGQLLLLRVRRRAAHLVLRHARRHRLGPAAPPSPTHRAPRAEASRRHQGPQVQGRRQPTGHCAGYGRLQGESIKSISQIVVHCDPSKAVSLSLYVFYGRVPHSLHGS